MAKAKGKGTKTKPAVGEITLPGGAVLKVDGAEAEAVGAMAWRPHKVAKSGLTYWAARTGAPPFEKLGHPINARNYDTTTWRDYTTHRRLEISKAIERMVSARIPSIRASSLTGS